jgi:hypothetical protein
VAGGVEFLGRFEHGLGTEGGPGIVSGKQCLEFADDLLGGGLRDQVALDFQLERLLEEIGSVDPHL